MGRPLGRLLASGGGLYPVPSVLPGKAASTLGSKQVSTYLEGRDHRDQSRDGKERRREANRDAPTCDVMVCTCTCDGIHLHIAYL